MARPPRIEFDGAWYHVMNRGAGKRDVFLDNADRRKFLSILGEVRDIWNVEIHAYSLMDNHYHLLVHTPNGNLSASLRHIGAEYTQYYNWKHKTDGPLFRGRFKSILVEKDSYFLSLVRYIHMNPVRAGLCNRPEQHSWTSHAAYIKKIVRPAWLVTDTVLKEFGSSENSGLKKFHEHVLTDAPAEIIRVLEAKRRLSILGSSGFRDWVRSNLLDDTRRERRLPALRSPKRIIIEPERILNYIATEYQTSSKELLRNQGRQGNESKSITMELLRKINGMTHAEIAGVLKSKPQAVSKQLQRIKKKRKKDAILNERVFVYTSNLMSHVQS